MQLTIEGLRDDRPERPAHLLIALLFLASLLTAPVSVPGALLLGALAILLLVWRLTGLGAPVRVAAMTVDLEAQVIRLTDPDIFIPFGEILEPVLIEPWKTNRTWRLVLRQLAGDRSRGYLLVTDHSPEAIVHATGLRVEVVEYPPPVI